jgi:hypothetical protein
VDQVRKGAAIFATAPRRIAPAIVALFGATVTRLVRGRLLTDSVADAQRNHNILNGSIRCRDGWRREKFFIWRNGGAPARSSGAPF